MLLKDGSFLLFDQKGTNFQNFIEFLSIILQNPRFLVLPQNEEHPNLPKINL